MDATDGKKWVRFVAMQQKNTTLIYDLNTMKGTVESHLKKIAQLFKGVQFHAAIYKSQKTTNKQGHERVMNLLKFRCNWD